MLAPTSDITKCTISASDGELGAVTDVYFDDVDWVVRYLVVDTGKWLPRRRVLLSPAVFKDPYVKKGTLPVVLTKQHVKDSPGIETEVPVSRQHEVALAEYYQWPAYWGRRMVHGSEEALDAAAATAVAIGQSQRDRHDAHLRSIKEIVGYDVHACDEDIGKVTDFIIEPSPWTVRYVVVGTGGWWSGKKTLVSREWFERIDWTAQKIYTDLSGESIKKAPHFDPAAVLDRSYEDQLCSSHGRSRYWEDKLETTLAELITVSVNSADGFSVASEAVEGNGLQKLLMEAAVQRRHFAHELKRLMPPHGRFAAAKASAIRAADEGLGLVASGMPVGEDNAVLGACLTKDRETVAAYARAITQELPVEVRETVERQSTGIRQVGRALTQYRPFVRGDGKINA